MKKRNLDQYSNILILVYNKNEMVVMELSGEILATQSFDYNLELIDVSEAKARKSQTIYVISDKNDIYTYNLKFTLLENNRYNLTFKLIRERSLFYINQIEKFPVDFQFSSQKFIDFKVYQTKKRLYFILVDLRLNI